MNDEIPAPVEHNVSACYSFHSTWLSLNNINLKDNCDFQCTYKIGPRMTKELSEVVGHALHSWPGKAG